ncbi:MAG: Hint domain-containing protein [Pseudomonadota bacterium]
MGNTVTVFQTVPVGADTENTTANSSNGSGTINLSSGETETIGFDFTNSVFGDGQTFFTSGAVTTGTFVVDDPNTGTATYTITEAQWLAAGSPSSVSMSVGDDETFNVSDATYTLTITCFAGGTMIATPDGESAVETLTPGDLVRTADGRDVPVRWLGQQTIVTRFFGERAQPVRIAAGALGKGVPAQDLTVTADHGMVLDGLVVNAASLVNNTTICWVPLAELPKRFTVYHVETDAHDVILANGAPSESYIDVPDRAVFDNADEAPARAAAMESTLPRITSPRLLPADLCARLGIATHEAIAFG